MRIEAYTQVQKAYNNSQVKRKERAASTSRAGAARDQIEISSFGKTLQAAKTAVAGAPDVREDLVADIKSRIDSGTYRVDEGDFAQKLLSRYRTPIGE